MTVRIHDLNRWKRCKAGETLLLDSDKARKVILEVNCPEPTCFYVLSGPDAKETEAVFLAVVHGLETLEFYVDGVAQVLPTTEADFWYFTVDGDETGYESQSPVFTELGQRKARNHDLEMIMYRIEVAAARREAKQKEEIDAYFARRKAEAEAEGANLETGEVAGDGDDTPAA